MTRVCFCDDGDDFRQALADALAGEADLEMAGEACDGDSCLEMVDRERPDVLVTDLAMPGRNGFEVLDELRRRGVSTRVVMLSGFSAGRVAGAARALGAARYLEKSASLDEIKRAIREAAEA